MVPGDRTSSWECCGKSFGKKGFRSPGRAAERKEMTQHKPGTVCALGRQRIRGLSLNPRPPARSDPVSHSSCPGAPGRGCRRLFLTSARLSSAAHSFPFPWAPCMCLKQFHLFSSFLSLPGALPLLSWLREVAERRKSGFSLGLLLDLPFLLHQMETGMVPASQTVWAPSQVTHARRVQEGLTERQSSVGLLLLLPFFV